MYNFNETVENFNAFGTKTYENLNKLAEMNVNNLNKVVDKQMKDFQYITGAVVAQIDTINKAKDYSDVVKSNVAFGQKMTEDMVSKGRESVEFAKSMTEEYRSWAEGLIEQPVSKTVKTTKTTAKKVAA